MFSAAIEFSQKTNSVMTGSDESTDGDKLCAWDFGVVDLGVVICFSAGILV